MTQPTAWLAGGGEMGKLIRAKDWAETALGPIETWPQSLRSAISILLPSKAQICLFWGRDLVTIYNDAYSPVLGLKHPSALGQPGREVWSELWDVLQPLFESVLKTGEAFWANDHPFTMERKGFTEETFFDISYDPIRDESGAVGGLFCIVSETTGRVIGERRLRLLRDLGRTASDGRSVTEVFRLAAKVFDASPHDVPFAALVDADGRSVATSRVAADAAWPIERARAAGELVLESAELQALGPLSGGAWPEPARCAVVLPVAAQGQPPQGFLVAGASPRLALDERYRDFLRLVAANIGAAAAAARALEEQRAQAQALAEIDRAKTAFFSNVSHEFRTPLTLMLGPLEDTLGDAGNPLAPRQRERLELMRRNGLRLQRLVNTLLDFSRIEAGRAQASYTATNLARFTAELASNFSTACDKAGLALRVDCPPLSQPVYVDRAMWEKIVLNLVSNAFKFTFEGAIAVKMRETPQGAELRVSDTGIGVAPAELPRLFERFHRVEGARARTHEGSGIGLAFVQELVRMHGGEIAVESEPGRGSTFIVRLPFGRAHLPRERTNLEHGAPPALGGAAAFVEEAMGWLGAHAESIERPPVAASAAHILVVDDNADMRDYVARLLRSAWRVTTATNGRHALELIAQQQFDLVISDVMMPELDGFGLLQALKARPATADLPVMLLSARAGEESRIDGLAAGADDYIVKPFTAQQLLAQVGAQLTIRQARRKIAEERERLVAREQVAKREAELQRQHLVTLFMNAPNPTAILRGPQFVIELANGPCCEVWGKRQEEVINRPLYDVLPELRGQGFKQLLDGVMESGEPYVGKETPADLVRADGNMETVYFNFVYTPLRGVDGRVEGVLVSAFNVTDEVLSRERISALRREAEAANRSKDEFLAMLSHELRNPLAPIATAIQLMRLRGADVPELSTLERQAAHLTRLVDDLLDVSRITRGKIELRVRTVEIADAVLRAMEMAGPLLERRSHLVNIENVPRRGLAVAGDPERLAQVVFNLLSNAAKYSEPGSPIDLYAWRKGDRVLLRVKDQGAGIAPNMINRIFDMFVQQEQTIARSVGGLGLGLTIVRSLVEMHGGSISVRSPGVGHGSEFTVELPAAGAAAHPEPAAERAARPAHGPARRILVVDDNVDAGTALGDLLKLMGHEVEVVHDGAQALTQAPRFRPDIALIDIGLPVMDGYALAQRLRREYPGARQLKLIAVTGYGLERDRELSARAGFSDHLVKPIDPARLGPLLADEAQRSAAR